MRRVANYLSLALLVLFMSGCSGVMERQRIRSVSLDVYDGVNAMKTGTQQVGHEGVTRYDNLWNFTTDYLKKNASPQDYADTMPALEQERLWMHQAMGQTQQIDQTGTSVLQGLGWREAGPPDSLLKDVALIGGGMAAGAALW